MKQWVQESIVQLTIFIQAQWQHWLFKSTVLFLQQDIDNWRFILHFIIHLLPSILFVLISLCVCTKICIPWTIFTSCTANCCIGKYQSLCRRGKIWEWKFLFFGSGLKYFWDILCEEYRLFLLARVFSYCWLCVLYVIVSTSITFSSSLFHIPSVWKRLPLRFLLNLSPPLNLCWIPLPCAFIQSIPSWFSTPL